MSFDFECVQEIRRIESELDRALLALENERVAFSRAIKDLQWQLAEILRQRDCDIELEVINTVNTELAAIYELVVNHEESGASLAALLDAIRSRGKKWSTSK